MKLIRTIAASRWAAGFEIITCKNKSCGRWLTLRHIAARKIGIQMRDDWYCSAQCFSSAAEYRFAQLLQPVSAPPSHVSRMPLGLILISRGLVSSENLRNSVEEQKRTGEEIGEVLLRQGFVSEKQITEVRAAQWGCPVFTVPKGATKTDVHIPKTFVELHSMIPLHYVATTNQLLVGFVQGIEYGPLYAIEQMTGCKAHPCFVTPTEFRMQLQQREQAQGLDATPAELKFENVQTPAEMAQILSDYCLDLSADHAIISKCRDYLWARLICDVKRVDVLFKAI
jgi:hypothetical protein